MTIPTKSVQLHVRFKSGVPKRLARLAAQQGLRRAQWMRETVLVRASQVLDGHRVVPLSFATADGPGERILIRLTAADLKQIERAAKKEGTISSAYVRAVCMARLASSGEGIVVGRGGKLEVSVTGDVALGKGAIDVEDGGMVTIKLFDPPPRGSTGGIDPAYFAAPQRRRSRG